MRCQGDLDVLVSERLGDRLGILSGRQCGGGEGVTKVVQPDSANTGVLHILGESLRDGFRVRRCVPSGLVKTNPESRLILMARYGGMPWNVVSATTLFRRWWQKARPVITLEA